MISIDIYVPSVDETYEFQLDENAEIRKVLLEVVGMISKKANENTSPQAEHFQLYSLDDGDELFGEESLASCGIQDGDRLLLV